MSGCIEARVIISNLRNAYNSGGNIPFEDNALRSFCVVSLCENLRNEVKEQDYELVKWMLTHNNCYLANLGQALLRPFFQKFGKREEMKPFLVDLWEKTQNDRLKFGLLFDLFLYSKNELSTEFINNAFTYIENNASAFSLMIDEWLENKEAILNIVKEHLGKNKDNHLKTALWLFSLISVPESQKKEVMKILAGYNSYSNPIKRAVNFVSKRIEPQKINDELTSKWLDYFTKLKHSIEEGAKSVFKDDGLEVRVFISVRNRHLPYLNSTNSEKIPQKEIPQKEISQEEIPQLEWRYVALEEDDIKNSSAKKQGIINFLSVELFGGGFLSSSFKLEDYIKLTTLEKYFYLKGSLKSSNDDNKLTEFIDSILKNNNYKHPRTKKEEENLRETLKAQLESSFSNVGSNNKERWEKIIKMVERRFLFSEKEIGSGISIMFAQTFGAYYPLDIFVTLIPPENNQQNLVNELKSALNCNNNNEAISFWDLNLNKGIRTKIIHLERALSHMVIHLFTKIYALYFQHLITRGKDEVIKQGLSVMLGVPDDEIEIKSNDKNPCNDSVNKLMVDMDKFVVILPYPTHLDHSNEYKEITKFKVRELLIKLEEYYTEILNEQKKLRMKDAVVAIMGRNMSHNIGSHVLWHLGEGLTLDLKELEEENKKIKNNFMQEKEKTETKIKNFYSYLRERMGFIALIATERPSWAVERLLESGVDYFAEMDLLINNIVLTEKVVMDKKEYRFKPIVSVEGESKGRLIEFPHGSYGEQALYVILENIIRNTIKHNRHILLNKDSNGNISVNFELSVTEPTNNEWKRDYWKVIIRDNLEKYSESLDGLIKKLQEKADESIFDDMGKLKRTNLGFKEKRICAAFLRMIPQEDIDSEELKRKISVGEIPPLLTIDKVSNNEKGHLAHIIYLRKPKKALIITDKKELLNNGKIQALEEKGIYIINKNEAEELLKTDSMSHKFLVLSLGDGNKSWAEEFVNKHYLKLPHRILSTINNLSINKPWKYISDDIKSNLSNPNNLYTLFWERWLEYFGNWKANLKLPHRILSTINNLFINKPWKYISDDIKSNLSNPNNLYTLFWERWLEYFGNWKAKKVYIIHSLKKCTLKNLPHYYQVVDKNFNNYNSSSIVLSHDKIVDNDFYKEVFACEGYSGTEGVGGIIEILSNPEFSYLYEQLLESFLWKIVVIDERIFDKKDIKKTPPKFQDELTVEALWNKRQVRILNPEKFIEGDWSEIGKPHILIIHQGVIDKYNESHKGNNNFKEKWKNKIKIPFLVIDSDRGKPEGVEKLGAIWMQFSDLGDIMVHKAENSLSKYLLVDILTSLREGRNDEGIIDRKVKD